MFSDLWDDWQGLDKRTWKYRNRKHIPNLNYLFCEINKMLGIEHYNIGFPLPTTKNSLDKLKKYYTDMLEELLNRGELHDVSDDYLKKTLPRKYTQFVIDVDVSIREPTDEEKTELSKPAKHQPKKITRKDVKQIKYFMRQHTKCPNPDGCCFCRSLCVV
jgi:hypothetical protein